MSAWVLVPCLVALRAEYNSLAPGRDKGADGSIGDSAHTSSSDHTPDEDSDVLRDHDADSKNEVHALDIDSTGPWPPGADLAHTTELIRLNHATGRDDRLQNIIHNRRICSRSWGWSWRAYTGTDPHTNHAHFSARYTTAQENDTSPWGVEDIVTPADRKAIIDGVVAALKPQLDNAASAWDDMFGRDENRENMGQRIAEMKSDIAEIKAAVVTPPAATPTVR